jgi:excisionase family DNA binding protein
MKQNNVVNPLLTRDQAAKYLGIKTSTLAVWACTKRYNLAFIRVGRLCKYRLADLDAFIAHNVVGGEVSV